MPRYVHHLNDTSEPGKLRHGFLTLLIPDNGGPQEPSQKFMKMLVKKVEFTEGEVFIPFDTPSLRICLNVAEMPGQLNRLNGLRRPWREDIRTLSD